MAGASRKKVEKILDIFQEPGYNMYHGTEGRLDAEKTTFDLEVNYEYV